MKILKESHKIAGQSNGVVQKSQKHDANLQKNSGLYFQIGLILCLLASYGLFEMKFENKKISIDWNDPDEDDELVWISDYTIYKEPVAEIAPQPRAKVSSVKPPIIAENTDMFVKESVVDLVPSPKVPVVVTPKPPTKEPLVEDNRARRLGELSVVPIYPGCEKETTNRDRVQCMSDKLSQLVKRKFNTDLAYQYGLTGVQKISVEFKIDKNGHIIDIRTRAPHEVLEKEAERLALKIPDMIPGKQSTEPVSVLYNLPITFKVND